MRPKSRKHAAGAERLGRARPRYVSLTAGGKALVALSVALLAAAPAAGILIGTAAARQTTEQRLLDEGRGAQGRVTRLWRTRGESPKNWVGYEVTVDGQTYRRQVTAPARAWRRLEVGSPLEVRYAPSAPWIQHPRHWSPKRPTPAWLAPLIAAVLVAVGALVTLPIRSQRRLLAEGRATSAIVTSHSKAEHGQKNVHYTFRLLSGANRTGKSGPTKAPPAIGAAVPVLYDPEDPEHNAMYPFSLVELHR